MTRERTTSPPVLVTYATRYGSTQEVAEAIAAVLRERGLDVAIQPMRGVRALPEHQAIVLGAPFYLGRWHKDARRFLAQHRVALAQRSVVVFALGPLSAEDEDVRAARKQLDDELERRPWLTPIAVEMFGGKYDPSRLGLFHRLLVALPASPLHGLSARDLRDWSAVRAWANGVADTLSSTSAQ